METERANVIIIGAGAIGCAIAHFLSKEGVKTVVVEQDSIGAHASGYAPGIPYPQGVISEHMEVMLPLTARSFQLYKELYQQLPEETGFDYYFRRSVLLTLAFTQAEAQQIKGEVKAVRRQGFSMGWLDGNAVRLIDSRISPETIGAACSDDTGELDSYRYVLALAWAAERYGAEIRHGRFTGLKRKGTKLTGVQLSSGYIACDCAVLAIVTPAPLLGREIKRTRARLLPRPPSG